jgi:hypothetical protein
VLRIFDTGHSVAAQPAPDANGGSRSSAIVTWAPITAGLGAAGLVAWIRCPAPPPHLLSWSDLLTFAASHVVASCVAGAMGVLLTYAILGRWADAEVPGITLRTMVAAVWFAPLAVFLAETSTWALAASTALVASVTLLISRRVTSAGLHAPAELHSNELFHLPPEPALIARMLPALCASVSVQTGAMAAAMGYPLPAAALSGVGTAVITWRSGRVADRQAARPTRRAALVIALATILTCGGLTRYLAVKRGSGGSHGSSDNNFASATDSVLRSIFASKASPAKASTGHGNAAAIVGSVYQGIILLPEARPFTMIVPPLPALHSGLPTLSRVNPLSIPFFGAYWLFKAPDTSPPSNSIHARGSPAEHTFTSTDHAPLFMEAHQDFGVLLDLSCCRAVQIAVNNADRYIGTVSLELILINSRLPGSPAQSLGSQKLESTPHWRPDDDGRSFSETLTFAIPAGPTIREFDQATVRFQLATLRADTAAKTAIERFLFVPR